MSLTQLLSNPIMALVIGVTLSLLLYFRQKHLKRFSYELSEAVIVSSKVLESQHKLEIKYDSIPVPRVTRTVIRFWNSGKETIHGSDIANADKLRWELPEGSQILSLSVERTSRDPIQVEAVHVISEGGEKVDLSFDFLDRNDGAVISILHTAKASKSRLNGTIKGISKGLKNWSMGREILTVSLGGKTPKRRRFASLVPIIGSIWLIFLTVVSMFYLATAAFPNYFLELVPSLAEPDTHLSSALKPDAINWYRFGVGLIGSIIFAATSAGVLLSIWTRPPSALR